MFGCFGFFRYTISVMPLWELYSPKNFAGFFRPETPIARRYSFKDEVVAFLTSTVFAT